jgi:Trypsin-co-occurring domain 2
MMSGITVDQLIKTVEDALAVVATKSEAKLGITLTKADLELSAVATDEAGAKYSFEFVGFEAGGKLESATAHVLSLSLVPKHGTLALGEREADELAEAILALAAAIHRADQSKFVVTEGKVDVKFTATKEGKLKLVVGGATKSEKAHSMKLTFANY